MCWLSGTLNTTHWLVPAGLVVVVVVVVVVIVVVLVVEVAAVVAAVGAVAADEVQLSKTKTKKKHTLRMAASTQSVAYTALYT